MDTHIMNDTGSENTPADIRIIAALSSLSDEREVLNAYSEGNPLNAILMAKVHSLGELRQTASDFDATVVLLDHQMGRGKNDGELIVTIINALRHHPEHPIITIGVCYDPAWHKTFDDAGAAATLNGPINAEQISRLNAMLPGLLQKAYMERLSPGYVQHFSDAAVRRIDSSRWKREHIGVWSSKGGVGKSFLSTNLAVALGVLCDLRVLIIDCDMNCGDVATYLRVPCDRGGIYKLAQLYHSNNGQLSPLMLSQCVTPYSVGKRLTNLQVLTGAFKMSMAGDPMFLGERGMRFATALMDLLDNMNWDFVIFDLGQSFHNPMHLVPLRRNDRNLIVATAEKATCIELMYAVPELTRRVEISPERFNLVLNKWDDTLGVDPKELVQALRLPRFATVPYESAREVSLSLNHGRPLMLETPNPVSDAIATAVCGIYPAMENVWHSRGGSAAGARSGGPKFKLPFFGSRQPKLERA
jgi:MinD-like ATPase involved in chromosome partitioning or flagellar assembly